MKLSNPHTHTLHCDGKNSVSEMAAAAEALGFVSLGFSSHAQQNPASSCDVKDEKAYIADVRREAALHGNMRIHLGTEQDLIGWCDRPSYDYLIGAVHYLIRDGVYCAVDGKREKLEHGIRTLFGGDPIQAARNYYRSVAQMAEKLRPDILAHFDLLTKHNEKGDLLDTSDPGYRAAALEALEAGYGSGALLEVNTGGMARGYRTSPYPEMFILKRWKELGGRVILGSDCHNADYLIHGFSDALALIGAAGFTRVTRLGGFGEDLFVEENID